MRKKRGGNVYRSDDGFPEVDSSELVMLESQEIKDEPAEDEPPPVLPVFEAGPAEGVAIVLSSPNAFLVLPPTLPVAVKFWPLVRVDLPDDQAAVLLDPETHKALGATWRLWQEGDTPTSETQAAVDRQKRMARERRRCCGK